MKDVEYWFWHLPDERTGKMYLSRWKMSAETAAGYPGAVRHEPSREVRSCPEHPGEIKSQSIGGPLR